MFILYPLLRTHVLDENDLGLTEVKLSNMQVVTKFLDQSKQSILYTDIFTITRLEPKIRYYVN